MNQDVLKGRWQQVKGDAKARWARLTDDNLNQVEGNVEKLIGVVQERYGYQRARAQQEVEEFLKSQPLAQ